MEKIHSFGSSPFLYLIGGNMIKRTNEKECYRNMWPMDYFDVKINKTCHKCILFYNTRRSCKCRNCYLNYHKLIICLSTAEFMCGRPKKCLFISNHNCHIYEKSFASTTPIFLKKRINKT